MSKTLIPHADTKPIPTTSASGKSSRRWLFRMLAILVGLSPLLVLEGLCHLCDWGRPSLHDDPFVGFQSVRPLFVMSEDEGRYEIPTARQNFFRPDSFPATKGDDEFRVFCLGGSTVQGRPFRIETSFPTWLEISLNAADSSRKWNVINCGGISYASYRLLPILEEVLTYEPDLIILYTGHNEFLEARSLEHIEGRGELYNRSLAGASRLRTFTLLREGYLRVSDRSSHAPPAGRPILPTEVEALLDYRGGLEEYKRDAEHRSDVMEQYRYNLHRMIELCRQAKVDLMLVNPVSNFRDCPPFKALPGEESTDHQREKWTALCDAASVKLTGEDADLYAAIDFYEQACGLDPHHAGGFYNLGQCYDAAGLHEEAREAYLTAKELDICPLRILEPMNEAVLEVAAQTNTPLVDAQALFEQHSAGNITGGEWLLDHVHPSITGHQLLADALADAMVAEEIVHPVEDWEATRRQRYDEHFASLGELYFHEGKQRLDAVRLWAQGRTTQERPDAQTNP